MRWRRCARSSTGDPSERVDGFEDGFGYYCDDTDLAWRAKATGARTVFVADAVVEHEVGGSDFVAYVTSLRRRAGPVLFIERQIAHVWGAAIFATITVFLVEILLGLPVLSLSPILAIIAGVVFMVKAGMLSWEFYFAAVASFLAAVPMALLMPDQAPLAILLFGALTGGSFFLHGLKYHLQRKRSESSHPADG